MPVAGPCANELQRLADVRALIMEAAPSHVICIGRGVAKALGHRLDKIDARVTVLPQPNARLCTEQYLEAFRTCFDVVKATNAGA